jgi:hypothetical protein
MGKGGLSNLDKEKKGPHLSGEAACKELDRTSQRPVDHHVRNALVKGLLAPATPDQIRISRGFARSHTRQMGIQDELTANITDAFSMCSTIELVLPLEHAAS